MATDPMNYQLGPTRHAPQILDQFSDPRPLAKQAVGSMSTAPLDQSEIGTSAITNSAGRQTRKRGGGRSGFAAPEVPEGPLSALGDAQSEIIEASGLGKQQRTAPKGVSPDEALDLGQEMSDRAERMSDANPPNPVSTGNPAENPDHPLLTRLRERWSARSYFAGE